MTVPLDLLTQRLIDQATADLRAEVEQLKAEIEDWRSRLAAQCGQTLAARYERDEARAEVEQLKAAIAYVRMRSAHACEVLNEFDNIRAALDPKP
jgi:chromosome segregation ATPase